MKLLGLDEAGRGCVLGALVVGGFLVHDDDASLRAAGAADSKTLTHPKRVQIRERLRPLGQPFTREIPPAALDDGNLNTLEIQAFIEIILECQPDHVFLDAPVNPRGIPKLEADLRCRTGVRLWTIAPKADATYPVVGAASIFAKVLRDERLAEIAAEHGAVGSGYPSDPLTRAWLSGYISRAEPFPACVRTRWGTISALRQPTPFG